MDKIKDTIAAVESHPGWKAHILWSDHNRIYTGIYRPNRNQLLALIEAPKKDHKLSIEMMQNVRPPAIREGYINEFLRLLHNYLESDYTLVNHGRVLIKGYTGTGFEEEFNTRKSRIAKSPEHCLLKDMRNEFIHHSILPVRWTVTLKVEGYDDFYLAINNSKFLEYKDLSPITRKYLQEQGAETEIKSLVEKHGKLIDDFNNWIQKQFLVNHQKDVDEVRRLLESRGVQMREFGKH